MESPYWSKYHKTYYAWHNASQINLRKSTQGVYVIEAGRYTWKYVIMTKQINFLQYILNKPITSTLGQVYEAMKYDSKKGDNDH